jgi:hypothetical protein
MAIDKSREQRAICEIDYICLRIPQLRNLIIRSNGEYLSIFDCDRLSKRLGIVDRNDIAITLDSIGNLAETRP